MRIVSLKNLTKTFFTSVEKVEVIRNVSFELKQGEIYSLVGNSGCGKSTLLNIIGLLDRPTSGQLIIDNQDCSDLTDKQATLVRRSKIGFVYQAHHLLSEFSTIENVMMPLLINKINYNQAKIKAEKILDEFDLLSKANSAPAELSGGQQQRVAIARALVIEPKLLLADEPTGNLDQDNAEKVYAYFLEIVKKRKITLLMVTHNLELAKKTDRILSIDKGSVAIASK